MSLLDKKDRDQLSLKFLKFTSRFLPIQFVCTAHKIDILQFATTLFDSKLSSMTPSTICVVFESRNNASIDKDEVERAKTRMLALN